MTETEEAIRRFLAGDEQAFGRIVRLWEYKVYNLAWRLLGNREDAQDATQDTFFSVFRSLGSLRAAENFPAWLYRITLNHCRARWRTPAPEISLSDRCEISEDGEERPLELPSTDTTGAALENADLIRKALMGVSEDHRTAIILKEYLGLSLEEAAVVMDCPLSTAKSRLYHGLRDVQRNLKRLGFKL
jgi:RNA polymerase sigma-70 factor, ECF subfamily